jgi:hypothetical protein
MVPAGGPVSMRTSEARVKQKIALSIMLQLLKQENGNYQRAAEYEQKYAMDRAKFLKIFNLYSVLSFITIFNKVQSLSTAVATGTDSAGQMGDVTRSGIDFNTLESQAFP